MTDKTSLEYLTEAREVFRDHGGAVRTFRDDDGRVCALGALLVLDEVDNVKDVTDACDHALTELSLAAFALYGYIVTIVNDTLGRDAVLHCYDHAIKTLEAQA